MLGGGEHALPERVDAAAIEILAAVLRVIPGIGLGMATSCQIPAADRA